MRSVGAVAYHNSGLDCAQHWFRTCAEAAIEALSGACCADTHDNQTGVREGNLYFELNRMLRERGVEERLAMLKVRAQSRWTAPNCGIALKSNTARGRTHCVLV